MPLFQTGAEQALTPNIIAKTKIKQIIATIKFASLLLLLYLLV
jgi:hypothetical protein